MLIEPRDLQKKLNQPVLRILDARPQAEYAQGHIPGATFDANKGEALPAGSYGSWPAGMKHYVWVKGETIVQFHGDGPWTINYLNAADDPRNAKK